MSRRDRHQRNEALEQMNLLELAPVRLAVWKEEGGCIVIERPKPHGWGRLREQLRYWLAVRRIRLDQRGSFVWRSLDGARTVGEVAEALREEFGSEVEPAEERTGELVRRLHGEDLLAYPDWDSIEEKIQC